MQKDQSNGSFRAKALSFTLISAFIMLSVIGSGWISMPAYGAPSEIDDPYDLAAAPHFRDVAYVLQEPEYLQRFDGVGKWKVSVGSPSLICDDSALELVTRSTAKAEISLYCSDAPGTNITKREYLEFKVKTTNASSGITLEDQAGHNASVVFSSATGVSASYKDAVGTLVINNAFYSSAVLGNYYRIGFELSSTTVSFFLYSADGTALANFVATAPLHAGKLHKISVWHSGSVSTTTMDWFYTASDSPNALKHVAGNAIEAMSPDSSREKGGVRVDPTTLKLVRSGSDMANEAYGIDPDAMDAGVNLTTFTSAFGATAEPVQRVEGKQFAEGWTDFRSDLEAALIEQIAADSGTSSEDVFLIDYYVDYLQLKTTFDAEIAQKENELYEAMTKEAINALGLGTGGAPKSTTQVSIRVPFALSIEGDKASMEQNPDWLADLVKATTPIGAMWNVVDLVSSGMNNAKSAIPDMIGATAEQIANATMKAIMSGLQPFLDRGLNITDSIASWMKTTTADFQKGVSDAYGTAMSWANAQVGDLTKGYNDTISKIQDLNHEYMTWADEQMSATNAMFSQMFLSMQESAAETQRYFAEQLVKTNEVITNVTDQLFDDGMWEDLMTGGKPAESTPLTLSGIFGTGLLGNTTFVVVLVLIVIVAMVGLILYLKGQGRRRR